jgi:hypothetical protein
VWVCIGGSSPARTCVSTEVRGQITSDRGRATIASQLYNAKDPMNLFELQAWLGHRSPESTRHYAQITPITLARAYTDAGYLQRNLRTIEVLLDRDAMASGAAGDGEPFEFYDLGHGYCVCRAQRGRGGIPEPPSALTRTPRIWWTWIPLRSNLTRDAAMYKRQMRARRSPTSPTASAQ